MKSCKTFFLDPELIYMYINKFLYIHLNHLDKIYNFTEDASK